MNASVKHPVLAAFGEILWDMLPQGRQCGGAPANVLFHARRRSAEAAIISAVGHDQDGDDLLSTLQTKGIQTDAVTQNDLPTGRVSVSLRNGIPDYVIHAPSAWDAISLNDAAKDLCRRCSAFVFGSLAQRDERSREALHEALSLLSPDCLNVFDVNIRQDFFSEAILHESLSSSDVLKLNDAECALLGKCLHLDSGQDRIIHNLFQSFPIQKILLTRGENGSVFYGRDGTVRSFPCAPCPHLEDTVGCGDAFLAAWLTASLNGVSDSEAMRQGAELAAFVASRKGGMPE